MNSIILSAFIIYGLISTLIISLTLTNLRLFRNRSYSPPFQGINFDQQSKPRKNILNGVSYWMVRNSNSEENWVVFLHGWWRDSRRNFGKADFFWQQGYSLVFVDARAHGQSRFKLINNGLFYATDVHNILVQENIKTPIILGTSFGSTAATIYAGIYPVEALILESLPNNFLTIFHDFYEFLRIPKYLFGWIPYLVIYIQKQSIIHSKIDYFNPQVELNDLDIPILLLHGEDDKLFRKDMHFLPNMQSLQNNPKARSWLIPGWGHSRLDAHPDYGSTISDFIQTLDSHTDQIKVNPINISQTYKPNHPVSQSI